MRTRDQFRSQAEIWWAYEVVSTVKHFLERTPNTTLLDATAALGVQACHAMLEWIISCRGEVNQFDTMLNTLAQAMREDGYIVLERPEGGE